ncbi:NAD(P)H-binding protein [Nocardia aurantia]|uniref:NAD(P)H azoreductase n=1 Tax=Nocardia aurantia TaxID=2585199 RepID=A0A7K0E102_9NOCA|nr:NAD(P)H-binding protein [Nocardia aurantia]MQY31182.1 NAD(P)H azoreductase [Nocardia aurantia]
MTNILVLGGTGTTGRRIAHRLRATGHPVRTAARAGADLAVDLTAPAGWPAAVADVSAAYLMEPAVPADAAGRERLARFAADVVAAGARRLVLLSAPGGGEPGHPLYAAERAVRDAGVEWTILRPNWFAQNFSEGIWRRGILDGTLTLPAGAGRAPFLDADDIADVAVAALTGTGHHGRAYELSGPRAIGFGEATEIIGAALGRPVRYDDIEPDAFVERQTAAGVPAAVARMMTGLLAGLRDSGPGSAVTDGVERALGRPARSFEDFAAAAAAAGAWRPEAVQSSPGIGNPA